MEHVLIRAMRSHVRIALLIIIIIGAGIGASGALHARGRTAPATVKPPGGSVGAWLGDGPIFGWQDPFGEGLWEHGWQGGGVGGIGGREWGGGGSGGTGGGGSTGGRVKDCLREVFTGDDLTTTVVEVACTCRLKFFKGALPPAGSYVEGTCERGSPANNDCSYQGDCCFGEVPHAQT